MNDERLAAEFLGTAWRAQLWPFWLAPILGATAAGAVNRWLGENDAR